MARFDPSAAREYRYARHQPHRMFPPAGFLIGKLQGRSLVSENTAAKSVNLHCHPMVLLVTSDKKTGRLLDGSHIDFIKSVHEHLWKVGRPKIRMAFKADHDPISRSIFKPKPMMSAARIKPAKMKSGRIACPASRLDLALISSSLLGRLAKREMDLAAYRIDGLRRAKT